jgi:hypothetical protein
MEQRRALRLIYAEFRGHFGLSKPAPLDNPADGGSKTSLDIKLLGVG